MGKEVLLLKRISAFCALTALVLALLCLLAASPALSAQLTRGVSWDTTAEDMRTLEGIPESEPREGTKNGEFVHYSFLHFADTPYVTLMTYVFKSEKLALYQESIYAAMQTESVSMTRLYTERLNELMESCGGPTLQDTQPAIDALAAITETPIPAEDIIVFTGWNLDGGTKLYLLYVKSDGNKCLCTSYVNEALLPGDGE